MSGSARWYPVRDADERAAQVAHAFEQVAGRAPAGVWASPGRVNLIGEHTDYNGGLCLPIALPQSTFVAAASGGSQVVARSAQRPDEPIDIALDDVGPGRPRGWGGYVAGAVAMLRAAADERVGGLTALVDSDVPVGAGLSSSAALSCSTVLACDDLAGLGWAADDAGRARLVEVCVRAENDVALAPTGGMDQAASLHCQAGHALLLDCADGGFRQVPFDVQAAGLALLVVDTRAEHEHSGGEYAQRRAGCEAAARALGVPQLRGIAPDGLAEALDRLDADLRPLVRHVVTEIGRVRDVVHLLTDGDLAAVGPVLDASHASLRDDYQVSAAELDLAVDTARQAGALGARMTGGGFGGSAIALVPAARVETVAEEVAEAFARKGWRAPAFLLAQPSSSGRRLR